MKEIYVLILTLFLWGCGDPDLFKFDKMGKPEGWEPDYSLILAKADFSLWDAFHQKDSDSTTFKKDENGRLVLEYRCPDMYTLGVDEIYSMKAEDMYFNGSFPINEHQFSDGSGTALRPHYDTIPVDYPLEQIPENVSVSEALLSVKSMAFVIINNARIGGMLTVVCENLYSLETGNPVAIPIPLSPDKQSIYYATEIPNLRAVLNGSSNVPMKFILMVDDITEAVMKQNILVDITTTGVDYKNVNLTLPSKVMTIPTGSFSPDIDFLNSISGNFKFTKPELRLTARSKGVGMNFRMQGMEFTGSNGDKTVTVQSSEVFQFTGESQNLNEVSSVFSYNSVNSNVVDFAALPPRGEVDYQNGQLECDGNNCWLYAGGKVALDVALRIPLEMSATNLVFYDTIRDVSLKDANKILKAKLRFEGENGLPMDFQIPELYLLDENHALLGMVVNTEANKVFGAATDAGPTPGSIGLELTKEDIGKLAESKQIVLKLVVNSQNQANVAINESARLNLKLRLDAKLDMGSVVFD